VASGKLREDLMYRLCVIPVNVPALRDRGDDAVLLAEMFLSELNEEHGEQKSLSAEGRRRIMEHAWPGNVRELKNVIHRAFVLSDEEVQVDIGAFSALGQDRGEGNATVLPIGAASGAVAVADPSTLRITVGMSLDDVERALITATLQAVGGSKTEAARLLGISLKTMYNRLHAYGDGCIRRKPMSPNGYDALAA
jgi:DNA-binding NtrC family response regulator